MKVWEIEFSIDELREIVNQKGVEIDAEAIIDEAYVAKDQRTVLLSLRGPAGRESGVK